MTEGNDSCLYFYIKKSLFKVKIKIYYHIIEAIIKNKCNKKQPLNKFLYQRFENQSDIIALKNVTGKNLLMININKNI